MERLIGDTLRTFGVGGALLAAAFAVFWWFFSDLHKQQGKGRWIALLRHDGFARRYRALMAAALDRIDARLSPGWDATPDAPKTEAARAWSHGLLNLCLLLAVAYPILSLLVYWALSGEAGRIGPLVVLPAEQERLNRVMVIGAVALMVVGGRWLVRASTLQQVLIAAGLLAVALASALVVTVTYRGAVTVAVAGAFSATVAFSRKVAGAGALAVAFALAFGVGVANGFSGSFGLTITNIAASAVAIALASAVAIMGASAVAVAQVRLGRRTGRPAAALGGYMLLLWLALWIVTVNAPPSDAQTSALLLFLGFLPLLNAAADFASVGLTRWLLRRGVRGNLAWHAGLDALSALAVLLALGFALIATVHLARPAGGAPLIDLAALFADLRDPVAAHDYYWLYFCFFSTLLPTALHLGVGCFGLFTLISRRLGRPIAAGLASTIEAKQRAASLAFTICFALAVWLPAMLIWQALVWLGRPALDALLWAFEGFARLIGAL